MSQSLNQFKELPKGWLLTTLEEVCLPVDKVSPRDAPDEPFSYIDIAAIDNSTFRVVAPKIYLGRNAPSRARQKVASGNILFSTVRTYLKNIAVVPPDLDGGVASTGFCVLNPAPEVNHRFIFYFVQTDEFVSRLNQLQRGTSYPAVRNDDVLAREIPLPSLPEQHRIVAEIEKQFTRLDASVASLERVRANLERYRTSVLKAACEGMLVVAEAELARAEGRQYEHADELLERILEERRALWESQPSGRRKYKEAVGADISGLPPLPEGWAWATIEQTILGTPQNGIYKPRSQYGCGMPILRIDDFQDFSLKDRRDLRRLTITSGEADTYGLLSDQLVINRVNSLSHLGKCLVVPESILPAVFESNMMRIATNGLVDSLYIAYYMRSPDGRSRLTSDAKWAVNQASINQKDVCVTPIPLPPLVEQRRIVAEVERRLSIIQRAEEAVGSSLKRAERLRQSVLKQAFCGRLVPQEPGDEPASALLERIRAERAEVEAATEANRKRRRRTRRNACPVS